MDFGSHEGRDPCTHSRAHYNKQCTIRAHNAISIDAHNKICTHAVQYTRAETYAQVYTVQFTEVPLYNVRTKVHKDRDDKM